MLKVEWSHLVVDSMREALLQIDPQSPREGVQRSLYKREREGGREGWREGQREGGRDGVREGGEREGEMGQALLASHVSTCAYYTSMFRTC